MREGTQKALNDIMDVLAGADGGGQFVKFKVQLDDIDKQAHEGNESACAIIEIVKRFARFVTL
jgi:hypothetical protein